MIDVSYIIDQIWENLLSGSTIADDGYFISSVIVVVIPSCRMDQLSFEVRESRDWWKVDLIQTTRSGNEEICLVGDGFTCDEILDLDFPLRGGGEPGCFDDFVGEAKFVSNSLVRDNVFVAFLDLRLLWVILGPFGIPGKC